MIAARLHAPEQVVEAEGHPGQWDVVAHVKRGPHPMQLWPAKPAIVRVVEEVLVVVPVHELVLERGQERREGDESDHQRNKPGAPVIARSAVNRLTRLSPRPFSASRLGGRPHLERIIASHDPSSRLTSSRSVRIQFIWARGNSGQKIRVDLTDYHAVSWRFASINASSKTACANAPPRSFDARASDSVNAMK